MVEEVVADVIQSVWYEKTGFIRLLLGISATMLALLVSSKNRDVVKRYIITLVAYIWMYSRRATKCCRSIKKIRVKRSNLNSTPNASKNSNLNSPTSTGKWSPQSSSAQRSPISPKQDWRPDEAVQNCQECRKKFNFVVRRHHCRECLDIFCSQCTRQRISGQRMCNKCFDTRTNRTKQRGK